MIMVKCFKGWISKINGVLLRKRNFAFVCFCYLGGDHYSKDSKKEENVEYKIVTRTITSCYIFRRKMIQQKEVEIEQVEQVVPDQTR